MKREELAAWLRLFLTHGAGHGPARKLLAAFGPAPAVFEQPANALEQVVSASLARALREEPPDWAMQVERSWQWLHERDSTGAERRIVTLGDADYPPSLLDTEDPPLILFLLGQAWPLQAARSLAVVGSRNPTPQGADNGRAFAKALSQAGLTVVSGLALGVDGAAHEGALDGMPAIQEYPATIAVVGTGLDRVYPARHHALAQRVARHGLIISEFPLGTPPLAQNFPQRNRIIAGLAQGTLVVEAALKSGSLTTARCTVEQGKEVFAIPGSIHSPQSRGCHALIRQGAKLVESAQDILEELKYTSPGLTPATHGGTSQAVSRRGGELLKSLGFDPVSLDALVARTGMDAAALQAQLLELELEGQVARLPGALFQRTATV